MKINFKLLTVAMLTISMASCGAEEAKTSDTASSGETAETPVETPAEEMVYETFTIDQLKGDWKAVDAVGYSKDKIIGQIYTFGDSTSTFYGSYGDGGMRTGSLIVEDGKIKLTETTEDPEFGTSSMTTTYEGGFNGGKLYLNSMSEQIVLSKN